MESNEFIADRCSDAEEFSIVMSILSLPRDILCCILAFIPFRPLILVVSLVCKRFRIAALLSVTSYVAGRLVSPARLGKALTFFPSLTSLELAAPKEGFSSFTFSSLRHLSLEQIPEDLVNSLSSLSLQSLSIDTTVPLSLLLASASSLTSLTLTLFSDRTEHYCEQLAKQVYFPKLRSLTVIATNVVASTLSAFISIHASQLAFISLRGDFSFTFWALLQTLAFPRLRELVLCVVSMPNKALIALCDHSSGELRIALDGGDSSSRAKKRVWDSVAPVLAHLTWSHLDELSFLPACTRLASLHLRLVVDTTEKLEFIRSYSWATAVQHLTLDLPYREIETHLSSMSQLTSLALLGLPNVVSASWSLPCLRELEVVLLHNSMAFSLDFTMQFIQRCSVLSHLIITQRTRNRTSTLLSEKDSDTFKVFTLQLGQCAPHLELLSLTAPLLQRARELPWIRLQAARTSNSNYF